MLIITFVKVLLVSDFNNLYIKMKCKVEIPVILTKKNELKSIQCAIP